MLLFTTAAWAQCTTLPEADQVFPFDESFGSVSVAGDFTGDGIDDLVAVRVDRGNVFLDLLAGSSTGLARLSSLPITYSWGDYTAADVSGDGIDDLVISMGGATLEVLLGSPNGLVPGFVGVVPNFYIGSYAVGDVTGDGIEDLLVFHGPEGTWQEYYADIYSGGPTGFGPVLSNGTVPRRTYPFRVLGDIDNDGSVDYVLSRDGALSLFRAGPAREITVPQNADMSYVIAVLPISDLDGDGLDDLVVVGDSRPGYYYSTPTTTTAPVGTSAEVHLTRLSGATEPSTFLQVALDLYNTANVSLGDRDGDGLHEVAFGSALNARYTATGWSGNIQVFEVGPNGFSPHELLQSTSPCGIVQYRLHAGDFNGDGVADLVAPLPYLYLDAPYPYSALMTFFSDPTALEPTETTPTTPTTPTTTDPSTDPTTPDEPPEPDPGCTCTAAPAAPSGLWLIGLALLSGRRRSRGAVG